MLEQCLLICYFYMTYFCKKNLVTSAKLLRADISIIIYIRLSVLLHGTTFYPLGNFHVMVKIEICFYLTKTSGPLYGPDTQLCYNIQLKVLLGSEKFQLNFVQNIQSHIQYQIYFFLKIISLRRFQYLRQC